jgi:hypothetical protein
MLRFASRLTLPDWFWTAFPLVIPLVLLFAGCGDTCFVFVSNPSAGSINVGLGNPASACGLFKTQGRIQVRAHLAHMCQACSESNQIGSVWVALSGVELHRTGNGQEPSYWQELPLLVEQPLQVDLMEASINGAVRLGDRAALPAGSYDMVRLRFTADQRGTGLPNKELDPCREAGPNCVVMTDGRIIHLLLHGTPPEVLIPTEALASGPFFVLPDTDNELLIELVPVWYAAVSSGEAMRFFPVLMGSAKAERIVMSTESDSFGAPFH